MVLCQCVAYSASCDKWQDCRDSSDEEMCGHYRERDIKNDAAFPPAIVHLDGRGHYTIEPLISFSHCPETHFLCSGKSVCLPGCLSFIVSVYVSLAILPSFPPLPPPPSLPRSLFRSGSLCLSVCLSVCLMSLCAFHCYMCYSQVCL